MNVSKRKFADWLQAYIDYASYGEAPRRFYFWSGVSTLAGALQRKVWIDQKRFMWYPNFFIVMVAPPGVATKSTTADVGGRLLAQVPDVRFGPNNITWQALVSNFAAARIDFAYNGMYYPMSAVTLIARELGSLLNPKDPDLINLLIELWDGSVKYDKETKTSGNDSIICPWINVIGCTTPGWIADNIPIQALRGGFISRCVFLYADEKEKVVPYVDEAIPFDEAAVTFALVHDLQRISELVGPITISEKARIWGRAWYIRLWEEAKTSFDDDQIMGFISRKQTHMHKLAMVLSASRGDSLIIDLEDLVLAERMLTDVEGDMNKVFAAVGKSEIAMQAERFIGFVKKRQVVDYQEAYRFIHAYFPDAHDFEGIMNGAIRSGQICMEQFGNSFLMMTPEAWKARHAVPPKAADILSTPTRDS